MLATPGTHIDLTKIDFKAARGAALVTKSNEKIAYDVWFDNIQGRLTPHWRIPVVYQTSMA